MPEYKLYTMNGAGHITSRADFEAASDRKARAHAQAVQDTAGLELWSGAHCILKIEPKLQDS
ncbi:MAG TPA: hypothetical protein VHW05_01230 [Phenylobacterium sp.]|nr:hypothetical protein [Phenylobacterium sp.]